MSTNAGRSESTSVRSRRVRAADAGEMCVSAAYAKRNSAGAGDGARPNSIRAGPSATFRQKRPTTRCPSGAETNTRPLGPRPIRNSPAASVATTVSWFDTVTSASPRSPGSRRPFWFWST
ncbi:MAG: hypothetical protein IPK12_22150 [Gemmatimonadetes bacterium]|nr:hypothetical protein [Gemmatimonadota bacterium]